MKIVPDMPILHRKSDKQQEERQAPTELKLVGSQKKVKGHILFSYNEKTGEWKQAEWSEGDRQMFRNCEDAIRLAKDGRKISADYDEMCSWLKSLHPQSHWKPSEEQMRELRNVISGCSHETSILVSLENDLKKLM